jgi:hypothetical protein
MPKKKSERISTVTFKTSPKMKHHMMELAEVQGLSLAGYFEHLHLLMVQSMAEKASRIEELAKEIVASKQGVPSE